MINYIQQERRKYQKELEKYWPVAPELMAQYKDGTHTEEFSDGHLIWEKNGQLYRLDDKPAFIGADGRLEWQQYDQIHRDVDRPAIIYADGSLAWCQNGQYHRVGDRPACIGADGTLSWWKNGQQHRTNGPAVVRSNNKLEWWINDKNITKQVRAWLARKKWCSTPEQIAEFKLRFA
jgi:hypothetical protein